MNCWVYNTYTFDTILNDIWPHNQVSINFIFIWQMIWEKKYEENHLTFLVGQPNTDKIVECQLIYYIIL